MFGVIKPFVELVSQNAHYRGLLGAALISMSGDWFSEVSGAVFLSAQSDRHSPASGGRHCRGCSLSLCRASVAQRGPPAVFIEYAR